MRANLGYTGFQLKLVRDLCSPPPELGIGIPTNPPWVQVEPVRRTLICLYPPHTKGACWLASSRSLLCLIFLGYLNPESQAFHFFQDFLVPQTIQDSLLTVGLLSVVSMKC